MHYLDPCESFECPDGARCRLYPPTGEPFCQPDCSLDNGGCPANQRCSLNEVQCIRSPCPPVVECTQSPVCSLPAEVGPCDGNFLRHFYNAETESCEIFQYGGCEGNENNFRSLEECEEECIGKEELEMQLAS